MPRPKIAAIVTEYSPNSHAQHIVDRFLWGYSWRGHHHLPPVDLVSIYVDQADEGDLSRDRATRFPAMRIYPSIAEALTCGGEDLAVDGVVLIGEHGRYPLNEKGQRLYPRYEFFMQIVEVFRRSGRSAPLFSDKHLSWKWEWAQEMVDTARTMKIPFLAGSSLPVSYRAPDIVFDDRLTIDLGGQPEWRQQVREGRLQPVGDVDAGADGRDSCQHPARRRDGERGVLPHGDLCEHISQARTSIRRARTWHARQ